MARACTSPSCRPAAKLWRLKYRYEGKERIYSIGPFADVGLAEARAERAKVKGWLREGRDPVTARRLDKIGQGTANAQTFGAIADEWMTRQRNAWSPGHAAARRELLDTDLLPDLGKLPIAAVTSPVLLATLRKIEARNAHETLNKARVTAGMICRYAIATGRLQADPTLPLRGAFKPPPVKHRATIPMSEFPALFNALAAVPGENSTKLALYFLIVTAARTIEMRMAT